MTRQDDLDAATWRKASRSASSGNCVELAGLHNGGAVRDSKNAGTALCVGPEGMAGLIFSAKAGALKGL